MDECIYESSIIDELPPFGKDFKHTLKHQRNESIKILGFFAMFCFWRPKMKKPRDSIDSLVEMDAQTPVLMAEMDEDGGDGIIVSCHVFQHGIIARGLSTHKVPNLTKPTSKTTCTNRNGPKAIQDQVLVKGYSVFF
ncbi:hypothetical protein LXL04_005329 [Taraxacum kok-saghyz]